MLFIHFHLVTGLGIAEGDLRIFYFLLNILQCLQTIFTTSWEISEANYDDGRTNKDISRGEIVQCFLKDDITYNAADLIHTNGILKGSWSYRYVNR